MDVAFGAMGSKWKSPPLPNTIAPMIDSAALGEGEEWKKKGSLQSVVFFFPAEATSNCCKLWDG
jgi:hypothetical protein